MRTGSSAQFIISRRGIAILLWVASLSGSAAGQQWPIEVGARGFLSGAPFVLSNFDSVDAVNDNLMLSVPIASLPPGPAGSGFNLSLIYNSTLFDTRNDYVPDNGGQPPYSFHTDMALIPMQIGPGTPWSYSGGYGLYLETRTPEPVVIGSGLQSYMATCVYDQPNNALDMQSSQSAMYPVRLLAVFPDGSSHILYLTNSTPWTLSDGWSGVDWSGQPSILACSGEQGVSLPLNYVTQDGTFVRVTITEWKTVQVGQYSVSGPEWTMVFPGGLKVSGFANGTNQITDRNGNAVTFSSTDPPCYPTTIQDSSDPVSTIKDRFGRCIQIEYYLAPGGLSSTELITEAGASSSSGSATVLVTKVNWAGEVLNFVYGYGGGGCQFGYELQCDPAVPNPNQDPCVHSGTCPPAYALMMMVTGIDLSEAGFSLSGTPLNYSFSYGSVTDAQGNPICFCQALDVSLPRGSATAWPTAKIHYEFNPPYVAGFNLPSNEVGAMPIAGVLSKTLTHTDPSTTTTYTDTWQYGPGGVQNPDGSITSYSFYPPGTSGPLDGHTFRIEKKDASGNLLSRTEEMWQANLDRFGTADANVYLKADFRSVYPAGATGSTPPSWSAMRVYSEDVNGNPTEVDESDWVSYNTVAGLSHDASGGITEAPALTSTSAKRSTINSYYVQADGGANVANAYWSATAPVILNAKKSTEILSSGSPTAYSEFVYDDYNGAGTNPASGAGNLTQEWRWDSTKAAFPGATQSGQSALMLPGSNPVNAIETIRTYTQGDILTETDPRGNQKVYQYNNSAHPYPTDVFEAYGTAVQQHFEIDWDAASGLRNSETDPNQAVTSAGYDPRGRLTVFDQGGLRHSTTAYDDSAQTATTTRFIDSNGGPQTVASTDDLGRVWKTQSTDGTCLGGIQSISLQQTPGDGYTYQLASNPFCVTTEATMGWTRTKLNPLGRTLEVAHFTGSGLPAPWGMNSANSGTAATSYNANQYTVTDEAGVARTMTTDGLGRLGDVTDGTGVTASYTYDALDHLTGVTQGAQQRTFVYTSLGRLQSGTNPENGTLSYTYDNNGNLVTRTDGRSVTTTNTYDALNRLQSKSYSDGVTAAVTMAYDGAGAGNCPGGGAASNVGRLTGVSTPALGAAPATAEASSYDAAGRVCASAETVGTASPYGFGYQYNRLDGLTQEVYPSGRTVNYTYDTGGRVATVSGVMTVNGAPVTTNYTGTITYAPHQGLATLPLGSGVTEIWSYNDRLQVIGIQAAGGALGGQFTLNFYPCDSGATACATNNGNIWRETIGAPWNSGPLTEEYRYDLVNRLAVAAENPGNAVAPGSTCTPSLGGSWCQQFGYDGYGNRWVSTALGITPPANTPTASGHFDGSNHLTVNGAGPDASGNLQQIGAVQYTYDGENRLTQVASGGMVIATYAYDGEGRRVERVSGSTTTAVYDAAGELAAEYVTAGTAPAAPCVTCYLTVDHLGSTRLMTDGSGTPVACHDYQPFGEEIPSGIGGRGSLCGQTDNPRQKFTGKERDSELGNSGDPWGLDYFGARYFSSAQGRFTSPDEFQGGIVDPFTGKDIEANTALPYADITDPQTINKYAYVRNNPLRYVDPDGHAFGLDDLVGAVGGALVGVGTEVVKDLATGQHITLGAITGAAVGGTIMGEGIVNIPETLGGSAVAAAAAKGAVQGAVSNLVQQGVDNITGDQKGFSGKSLAVSTGIGAATGGLASKMPEVKVPGITSGSGNMKAVAQGVATKIENGTASSMSLKTAVKGAVGGQVANAGKTFTQTYGTAVTTTVCNANINGACK